MQKRGKYKLSSPAFRVNAERGGFSLIEVMVAILLLSIVAVGSAGFFYQSLAMIEEYRSRRLAMELATSEIDSLRKSHYTDIKPYEISGLMIGNWVSEIIVTVNEVAEGDARRKEVEVTVNWGMPVGEKTLSLNTIVGKR